MPLTNMESQQMGRIEEGVKTLVDRADGQEQRVLKLESHSAWTRGALAVLSLLFTLGCAYIATGCAHTHVATFYPNGQPKCDTATTVLGQGNVSALVEGDGCPDTLYESNDTGLSDNGVEVIEKAVAAGVRAAIPGL